MQPLSQDAFDQMNDDQRFYFIQELQSKLITTDKNIRDKQQRVDELIRENAKVRKKLGLYKCPYCENGAKIPDGLKKETSVKRPLMSNTNYGNVTKRNNIQDSVSEEDDPEVLAEIARLNRGRQGFSQQQCSKIKYHKSTEDV
jgi:hypothetical protein